VRSAPIAVDVPPQSPEYHKTGRLFTLVPQAVVSGIPSMVVANGPIFPMVFLVALSVLLQFPHGIQTLSMSAPARKLAGVMYLVGFGDHAPSESAIAVRDELIAAINDQLKRLKNVIGIDLATFNRQAAEAGLEAVKIQET
jgi:hypothetical protein